MVGKQRGGLLHSFKNSSLLGIFGSASYAATNFYVAYRLQAAVDSHSFGQFAFSLVMISALLAVSNAILTGPYTVFAVNGQFDPGRVRNDFGNANIIFSISGGAILFLILLALGTALTSALLFSILGILTWYRWFVRTLELSANSRISPVIGDLVNSAAVLTSTLWWSFNRPSTISASAILVGGIALNILTTRRSAHSIAWRDRTATLGTFLLAFKEHGVWSLTAVLTNEVAANAQAYIVSLLLGFSAFAPIAAVNLLFRPLQIISLTLTQYERARIAMAHRSEGPQGVSRIVRAIDVLMVLSLIGNVGLVGLIVCFFPTFIGGGQYAPSEVAISAVLFSIAIGIRSIRTGASTALQALGWFRPLAFASYYSAPPALAGVAAAALAFPAMPSLTLTGVIIGDIIGAIVIMRTYHRLRSGPHVKEAP